MWYLLDQQAQLVLQELLLARLAQSVLQVHLAPLALQVVHLDQLVPKVILVLRVL
jgi:hypothetical protein